MTASAGSLSGKRSKWKMIPIIDFPHPPLFSISFPGIFIIFVEKFRIIDLIDSDLTFSPIFAMTCFINLVFTVFSLTKTSSVFTNSNLNALPMQQQGTEDANYHISKRIKEHERIN